MGAYPDISYSGPSAPGCFFVIEGLFLQQLLTSCTMICWPSVLIMNSNQTADQERPLHELGDRFRFPELDDSTSAAVDDQGKLTSSSSPSLSVLSQYIYTFYFTC